MSRSKILIGTALTCAAGIAFAGNSTAAKLAYEGGTNPLTYLTLRAALAALLVLAIIVLTRRSLRMPPRRRLAALGLGGLAAFYSFGLLSAIEFIPVALAVLIFYTFPLFTSAFTWLSGRGKPNAISISALIVAFAGLAIALDVGGEQLNFEGVALAFMAALGLTAVVILNSRMVGASDPNPVTFHMMLSAAVIGLVCTVLFSEIALPDTSKGWFHLGVGTTLFACAIVTIFFALSLVGTVATSLTMNIEPVASLIFGVLILGQVLTGWQIAGAALVIAAVLSVRLADLRKSDAPSDPSRDTSQEARP